MAKYLIQETQIVSYQCVVEADTEDQAREGWLDASLDVSAEKQDITDSHGLTVTKIED